MMHHENKAHWEPAGVPAGLLCEAPQLGVGRHWWARGRSVSWHPGGDWSPDPSPEYARQSIPHPHTNQIHDQLT